jgi:CheY-like chemotaxis protein
MQLTADEMSRPDSAREAVDRADASATSMPSGRLDGLAILVVDDVAAMRGAIAGVFSRAGARVLVFDDPVEALAAIQGDPEAWALLVTDHDMPQMTGSELARAARIAAPALPVMLCTALPDWHGQHGADGPLFDALVGKPARPDALLSGARAALDRRAAAPP